MGCLHSRTSEESGNKEAESEEKKVYSWDLRPKIDPKDITIEELKGETAGRLPGTVNGTEFIIRNCEDCNIYIFDHTNSVQIDDCINCRIFLGPVKTSVFVRDCTDCKVALVCQQFRTRDCKKIDTFIACVSQPIIEASTSMKFGCLQCSYPELNDHFQKSGLSIYNNNWSSIYDFTPVPGEQNFTLLPSDANIEDFIPLPSSEQFADVKVTFDADSSLIPRTLGTQRKPFEESCLTVFFHDGGSHDRAADFISQMRQDHSDCVLVQSKEIAMQPADAQRVFGTDNYAVAVQRGAVIGLEYNGSAVCNVCRETLESISKGSTGVVFVSANPTQAPQQIENFYNFADMQMNG